MPYIVKFDPTSTSQQATVIPNVTDRTDGIMPASVFRGLVSTVTLDIYIDAENGNDSNTGLSEAQALQTFNAAWAKIPTGFRCIVQLHFAVGDYIIDSDYFIASPTARFPNPSTGSIVKFLGTAVSQLGDLVGVAGSDTTTYVAVTEATTSDQFRRAFLTNLDTGERVGIRHSSYAAGKTTFELNEAITDGVGANFKIDVPGTNFLSPAFSVPAFLTGNYFIGFADIKFANEAEPGFGLPQLIFTDGTKAQFEAVQFDLGSSGRFMQFVHSSYLNTADVRSGAFFGPGAKAGFSAISTGGGGIFGYDHSTMEGGCVCDGVNFAGDEFCLLNLGSVSLDGGSIAGNTVTSVIVGSGELVNCPVTVSEKSTARLGGFVQFGFPALTISDSPSSAVEATYGSQVLLGEVDGTGNAEFGVAVSACSQAFVNQFTGSTTVTGTSGDTQVGATTKAYGALPFTEANTLCRIE